MKKAEITCTREPSDIATHMERFDREYTRFARLYDLAVRYLPVWKTWLKKALPHISGESVLELSFGTGYLMCLYADKYSTFGADYNYKMVKTARANLSLNNQSAGLVQADVFSLPYRDCSFDCVLITMSFSGYPDGRKALSEIQRVLRPGGKLVIIDFCYPENLNRAGVMLTRLMERAGDIIRNMEPLLNEYMCGVENREIGGFGSVHLYTAVKMDTSRSPESM